MEEGNILNSKVLRYQLATASNNIILLFSSGAIIQSFLAFKGFSAEQIGIYTFCISAIQIITLLISMFSSDSVKNIPKAVALFTLPSLLFFAVMIILAAFDKIDVQTAFVMTISVCCLWNFFYGLRTVLQYKLPYYVVKISEYPKLENTAGIVSNVICTVISGAFVFFSRLFDYQRVILICFLISTLFVIVAFLSVFSLGSRIEAEVEKKENQKIKLDIFKLKQTWYFILPNIIRGFSNGIMSMAAVIMLLTVTKDTSLSSSLTVTGTFAAIFSCIFYCKIYRYIKTVKIALLGGIIQFVGLIFLLCGNPIIFIIMYFIAYFGQILVDFAVPIYVTEIVPYEYVGGYTAVRMLFFNVGIAIGSFVTGIFSTNNSFILVFVCGIAQFIHVISYVFYERFFKRKTL